MVTVSNLLDAAPEFSGLTPNIIKRALEDADLQLSLTAWGDLRDRAVILTAAHGLSQDYPGARPGDYDSMRYINELGRIRDTLGLTMTVL